MEPAQDLGRPQDRLILIVDDDESVRDFLEMTATGEGFQAMTAGDGAEAMQKVQERRPDLVITDLMMPGEGGYEFLRRLQGTDHRGVPVFVITASQINESTAQLIRQEANVARFIRKPFSMEAFALALHHFFKTAPPSKP